MLDIDSRGLEAFEDFADSLDELVFVWKPNGDLLWMNRAFMRESGKTTGDLGLQDPDKIFVHPDDLELVLGELGTFLDSEALQSQPIVHRFSDGIGVVSFLLASGTPTSVGYRWLTLVAAAPIVGVLIGLVLTIPDVALGALLGQARHRDLVLACHGRLLASGPAVTGAPPR